MKNIFIVVGANTSNQKKIITNFLKSRAKEDHKLIIEINEYLGSIEDCCSLIQDYYEELEFEDSPSVSFICSLHHSLYKDLKKHEILYKSKEYIISKNKKFEKIEKELFKNHDEEMDVISIKKKKDRQVKRNSVFTQKQMFPRQRYAY